MTPETKHHLIVGGGLVVAVVVGIIVYKKYQAGASASQAASDQSNQDELAYLEASSLNSPYGYQSAGGGSSSISLPSSSPQQSIADELLSLEQDFGLAPPSAPASSGSSSPSTPSSTPTTTGNSGGGSSTPPGSPSLPAPPQPSRHVLSDEPATMQMEHEAFV